MKKLVETGYLIQERSFHDRRMTRVRLSQKGLELVGRIDALYAKNAQELMATGIGADRLSSANELLGALERFWSNYISRAYQR